MTDRDSKGRKIKQIRGSRCKAGQVKAAAYDLANRRLQPLGHLSVRVKHVFGAVFSVKAVRGCNAENAAKAR